MLTDNTFLRNSLVLDVKVVRTGKQCMLILKSAETMRSVSRRFGSWLDLRRTLARFVAEDRLGLADLKLGGPEHEASHTFVSVPFPRVSLQALGFSLEYLWPGPLGQGCIASKQELA